MGLQSRPIFIVFDCFPGRMKLRRTKMFSMSRQKLSMEREIKLSSGFVMGSIHSNQEDHVNAPESQRGLPKYNGVSMRRDYCSGSFSAMCWDSVRSLCSGGEVGDPPGDSD